MSEQPGYVDHWTAKDWQRLDLQQKLTNAKWMAADPYAPPHVKAEWQAKADQFRAELAELDGRVRDDRTTVQSAES